jgi:branched-chain amino acid transport system permease protein
VSGCIERWNFLLGAVFVAIVILMPEGLVPGTARLWRLAWRKRARRDAIPGVAEPSP